MNTGMYLVHEVEFKEDGAVCETEHTVLQFLIHSCLPTVFAVLSVAC